MTVSTDANLWYGVLLPDEGRHTPWRTDSQFDSDLKAWWRHIHGYAPPFEMYTDTGGYLPGFSSGDPRVNEYYAHLRQWEKDHPLPFEEINYCSCDYGEYGLAVPGTVQRASRGYPHAINPYGLVVQLAQETDFIERLKEHGLYDGVNYPPRWWLTSLWC